MLPHLLYENRFYENLLMLPHFDYLKTLIVLNDKYVFSNSYRGRSIRPLTLILSRHALKRYYSAVEIRGCDRLVSETMVVEN